MCHEQFMRMQSLECIAQEVRSLGRLSKQANSLFVFLNVRTRISFGSLYLQYISHAYFAGVLEETDTRYIYNTLLWGQKRICHR